MRKRQYLGLKHELKLARITKPTIGKSSEESQRCEGPFLWKAFREVFLEVVTWPESLKK